MSSRHRRTLEEVFHDPVKANLVWADIERMLVYYGAVLQQRGGSIVAVRLNDHVAVFHRPASAEGSGARHHPQPA